MLDILFSSVPYTDTDSAIMAPALLKAVAVEHGYTAKAIDLNAEMVNQIRSHRNAEKIIDFWMHNNLHSEAILDISGLLDHAASRLLEFKAKTIALSLLTLHSQSFTYWLCVKIKTLSPETKIVIGGSGIKSTLVASENSFCEDLKNRNLIDHYISGDGEEALIAFMRGDYSYPGIDSDTWIELKDIDEYPAPDYDDYDFSLYPVPAIPVTDSRGCVRECEFCDVIEHWKKFAYRTADSVFAEMLEQIKRYQITRFEFRNSLTNGNLKEFKKLMDLIAQYNHGLEKSLQISWLGYFIIRSEKSHPESLWEVMAKTNPLLLLGVESVVKHVRWGLGKKFDNEDIDFHLEMAKKYKIQLTLLLMAGYPTETREDYEFTKQWFRDRLAKYTYGDPIVQINISNPAILENTALDKRSKEMNLDRGKYPITWMSQDTKITISERADYRAELTEICQEYTTISQVRTQGYETLGDLVDEQTGQI